MAHDPQWLYIGRRTLMARLLALASSVPVVAMGARSAAAQSASRPPDGAGRFAFGILGDMPYTRQQEAEYARVLDDINARDLAFVAHVGDMVGDPRPFERDPKSARQPATDENYAYVLDTFKSCKHPLILTPGDNDWADVVEFTTLKVDPLERLAKVRSMFYAEPSRSLGTRTIALESQAGDAEHKTYVENRMWSMRGVTFATLHIMGSNDNASRTPELVAEYQARRAANMAWLRKAFARAKADNSLGLVLIAHANPGFENFWPPSYLGRYFRMFHGAKVPSPLPASAYDDYVRILAEESGELRQADHAVPWRHAPVPHRQAAVQRQDQAAVRELYARGDVRLAGLTLDSCGRRSGQTGAVHLYGTDRAGKQAAPYVGGGPMPSESGH